MRLTWKNSYICRKGSSPLSASPIPGASSVGRADRTPPAQWTTKTGVSRGWFTTVAYPSGKADIVHQSKDAGREEVAAGKNRLQWRKKIIAMDPHICSPLTERMALVSSSSSEKEKITKKPESTS